MLTAPKLFLTASIMGFPFFCYGVILRRPLLLPSSINLIVLRSPSPRSAAISVKTKLAVVRFVALAGLLGLLEGSGVRPRGLPTRQFQPRGSISVERLVRSAAPRCYPAGCQMPRAYQNDLNESFL